MWDLIVRVVCKRKSVKTQGKVQSKEDFAGSSREAFLQSEACDQHMTGMRRVRTGWWQLVFASVSRVRPSREIPTKHSVLPICHIWYTLSLPILYIPILPTDVEECFREKTLATIFESVRLLYSQFSTQSIMVFPQLLPFHFYILERLIAQTLTTPLLSVNWGFGAVGKHWKKLSFGGCNRAYCRIRRARQDTVSRSLVRVGAWRA